jgi:uncharacterized protein YecA (UPF0149 family)
MDTFAKYAMMAALAQENAYQYTNPYAGIETPRAQRGRKVEAVRTEAKIGRNEPCPCESGKKYKKCCLK